MFKRRSTLDQNEKIKKNRQTECYLELDKCLQIPNDDKLIIRRKIKDFEKDVITLFDSHKRYKNYCDLQIKLRKVVHAHKLQQKQNTLDYFHNVYYKNYGYKNTERIYSQNSQPTSLKTSAKVTPQKAQKAEKKKVIAFDVVELKNRIYSKVDFQDRVRSIIGKKEDKDKIKIQINNPSENSFQKKQNQTQRRGRPLNDVSNMMPYSLNIKKIIESKIQEQRQPFKPSKPFEMVTQPQYRATSPIMSSNSQSSLKMGVFYKKIRQIIDQ